MDCRIREEEERLRILREQEAKEAEEKKRKEEEGQKKMNAWLKQHGFKGVNDAVRKKFSKITPLAYAIQKNDVEILKLLLQNGADASKVNGKNESALAVAQKM